MGRAKNNKAKNSALKKTTANLTHSQEPGQTCEPENKRPTQTPKTTTPFSTARIQDEFEFGDVVSIFGGANEKKNPTETPKPTPPLSTAGIQDELEFRGRTSPFWGGKKGQFAARGDLSEDAEISAGVLHAEGQFQRRHLTDTNNCSKGSGNLSNGSGDHS